MTEGGRTGMKAEDFKKWAKSLNSRQHEFFGEVVDEVLFGDGAADGTPLGDLRELIVGRVTESGTAPVPPSHVLRWTWDHRHEAAEFADKLNIGYKPVAADRPVQRSLQPGWGVKRDSFRKWIPYGKGH